MVKEIKLLKALTQFCFLYKNISLRWFRFCHMFVFVSYHGRLADVQSVYQAV